MTYISSLQNIHKHGTFGDYENKNENELLKLKEVKNLIIYQIVKFKNSTIDVSKMNLNGLRLPDPLKVKHNSSTRILWMGPDNWLVMSDKKNIFDTFKNCLLYTSPSPRDLSTSRMPSSA